jgi:hypothetical protein
MPVSSIDGDSVIGRHGRPSDSDKSDVGEDHTASDSPASVSGSEFGGLPPTPPREESSDESSSVDMADIETIVASYYHDLAAGEVPDESSDDSAGDPADARVGVKSKAEVVVILPCGIIRYYKSTQTLVAHCQKPNHKKCRLTRTVKASIGAGLKHQGRPLGMLLAWLEATVADTCEGPLCFGSKVHRTAFLKTLQADKPLRAAARRKYMDFAGMDALRDKERARRRELESGSEP